MTNEQIFSEGYKRGYIQGCIKACTELSETIEVYTRALLDAIDSEVEELKKLRPEN